MRVQEAPLGARRKARNPTGEDQDRGAQQLRRGTASATRPPQCAAQPAARPPADQPLCSGAVCHLPRLFDRTTAPAPCSGLLRPTSNSQPAGTLAQSSPAHPKPRSAHTRACLGTPLQPSPQRLVVAARLLFGPFSAGTSLLPGHCGCAAAAPTLHPLAQLPQSTVAACAEALFPGRREDQVALLAPLREDTVGVTALVAYTVGVGGQPSSKPPAALLASKAWKHADKALARAALGAAALGALLRRDGTGGVERGGAADAGCCGKLGLESA